MRLRHLLEERKEQVLAAAARHGASNIRIIGSVARGNDRPGSDIDLLVKWERSTTLFDHIDLQSELEEILGRRVELASDGWLKPAIRDAVYQDAEPL
jgi:predicted nucleotidyltransferase